MCQQTEISLPLPLQEFETWLQKNFPGSTFVTSFPQEEDGLYLVDMKIESHELTLLWQTGEGFGISTAKRELLLLSGDVRKQEIVAEDIASLAEKLQAFLFAA
jgi:hypothetical protein